MKKMPMLLALAYALAIPTYAAETTKPNVEKVCKQKDGKEVCKEKKRPIKKHNTSDVKKDAKK